ncbi:MAG: stage 0 sporulation protein [Ruminococcaceae bacterium]|nr:stage 0 sporulation protein [Oscillospiraceae bacterium]
MNEDPPVADETVERVEVVGIRFRSAGKVYYFDPKGNKLPKGSFAIVETARGPEFGEVSFGNRMIKKSGTVSPLRPVLRAATDADIAHNQENGQKEKHAFTVCQQKIAEHKLDMKLIDAQYAFDNSKLLFYFSSEGRVDFRELVKDLASIFRTRIELRQIGIRDEAKMLGGLGSCGRPLCCASFLPDFMQVSIKMAKEQGLSLNSAKISGLCGRLMCCLRYESEVYAEELRRLPRHDATVKTPDGIGTVASVAPMTGMIKVVLKKDNETVVKQFRKDEITVLEKPKGESRSGAKHTERDGAERKPEEQTSQVEAPADEPDAATAEAELTEEITLDSAENRN